MIEIPLNSSGEQLFTIVIGTIRYDFRVTYNSRMETWFSSITVDGKVYNDIALLGGIDITKQYAIPLNNLFVVNLVNSNKDATESNLGVEVKLFKLEESELNA